MLKLTQQLSIADLTIHAEIQCNLCNSGCTVINVVIYMYRPYSLIMIIPLVIISIILILHDFNT